MDIAIEENHPNRFINLRCNQCRFPTPLDQNPSENMICCGKIVYEMGKSWCGEHVKKVFVPNKYPLPRK